MEQGHCVGQYFCCETKASGQEKCRYWAGVGVWPLHAAICCASDSCTVVISSLETLSLNGKYESVKQVIVYCALPEPSPAGCTQRRISMNLVRRVTSRYGTFKVRVQQCNCLLNNRMLPNKRIAVFYGDHLLSQAGLLRFDVRVRQR